MTRARDEIYVCGYTMLDRPPADCWHALVKSGFLAHPRHTLDDDIIRIRGEQTRPPEDKFASKPIDVAPASPPDWALTGVAPPPPVPEWRAPSRLVRPGMNATAALRGRVLHKLFQILPDLPEGDRENAAR